MIYNKQFIVRFRPYAVDRLTRLCKAVASASDAGPGIAGGRPRCAAGLTPYRLKPAWTNRNPPLFLTIPYLEDAGGLREKLAAPRRGGRVADMGRRQVRESSVAGERASAHLTPLRTRRACALAKTCPSRHRIQPPSLNFGA